MDDATLGDSLERVHDDLVVLLERLRAIGLVVRVVEASDLSLLGAPVDIQGIPGTIHEKRGALERMTSKLEVLNPHQAFVLLKNAFAIPKLQYVLRASPAYLCGEELSVFDRALFDSLGRVANVSLEGDVCKQAWLPVSFGGLGCRRAGDIALPSFIATKNSVGELVPPNEGAVHLVAFAMCLRSTDLGHILACILVLFINKLCHYTLIALYKIITFINMHC